MTNLWKAGRLVTPCGSLRSLALFQLFFHITPLCTVIGTFSQQMEKGKKPAPGQVEEPRCCPWENIDLKLTDLNCLTEETEGNPSIKYGVLIIWSIYFNDLKAKPAGLVTASKRYGEKTCSLSFHPDCQHQRTEDLCPFRFNAGKEVCPHAHAITHNRQRLAGQQVSYEHRMRSFTQAISNSLKGALLTDYFKACQFSCYNHPSEKTKSNRRTELGSDSNGEEQRTMQQSKPFLNHTPF